MWSGSELMLRSAKLVLGPVEDTVRNFCELENPAPIGFIAFDLDYYSSTRSALSLLAAPHNYLLPRVLCYFDDTVGDIDMAINEYTGELLAIREFNDCREDIKLAPFGGCVFLDRCRGYGTSRSSWPTCSPTRLLPSDENGDGSASAQPMLTPE